MARQVNGSSVEMVGHENKGNGSVVTWSLPLYADGKPKTLFRGWCHAVGALLIIIGVVFCWFVNNSSLGLGLGGKFLTYFASGHFHLYPYKSISGVTRGLMIDFLCVPFSVCGALVPFVADGDGWRQTIIAVIILFLNAGCVFYMMQGPSSSQILNLISLQTHTPPNHP